MEEMKPMGEGVIIKAFLTFPSDIMGRKEGGGEARRWQETRKGRRRMTEAANKHETANGISISREMGIEGKWLRVCFLFQHATSFHLLVIVALYRYDAKYMFHARAQNFEFRTTMHEPPKSEREI